MIMEPEDFPAKDAELYRKRPVEVLVFGPLHEPMVIETAEGNMTASEGDYIIQGVEGEVYPIKPGILEKTYKKIEVK